VTKFEQPLVAFPFPHIFEVSSLSFPGAWPKESLLSAKAVGASQISNNIRLLGCNMISLKLRSKISAPKVLVIDDEVQLAEVCRAVLQNAGAKAKVIYDGADAEEAINSFKPDIIISDIKMPEVRGDELLVMLRDHGYPTPVIMVTGLERTKISIPKDSPNLFALIYKPIEYEQLVRTVQNCLNIIEARQLNEALMQRLYETSKSELPFEEWQNTALDHLVDTMNKRRAS
jgi:DNA-binding NtrC family response regulator